MTDRPRSWPLACGLLAAVAQVNFLLENVLPGRFHESSLISELEATAHPYHWLYSALDVAAGLLTIELGRLAARRWRRPLGVVTGVLLVLYAVGLIVAAVVPTSCMSVQTCTQHSALTGGAPPLDRVHDVVSILGAAAILLAAGTAAWLVRDRRRQAALLLGTGLLATALALAELVEFAVGVQAGVGLLQRTQVVVSSVLLLLLGRAAATVPRRPPVPVTPPERLRRPSR